MTADEFRAFFNRVRRRDDMVRCDPHGGGEARFVVGLNGDQAVLHGGREIPLSRLREHPVNEDWLQETAARDEPA